MKLGYGIWRLGAALWLLAAVAACSPLNLQKWTPTAVPSGNAAFALEGYTSIGELTDANAAKYLDDFAIDICKGSHKIARLETQANGNAFGKFLHWTGIVECDALGREDARFCSAEWKARKPQRPSRC